ncbi:MAG: ATP-binding protein [Peptococcaceae bacterium]|nr:ATP-binding protein [Peptococcaceae bacterium]
MEYFISEDWQSFCYIDGLCQKAGVSRDKIPALVVKEVVDNALDAGGGICTVDLTPDGRGFIVQDDGPGIPHEMIPELFSVNRPRMSTKLKRMPSRGALGNGLKVVMGAVISYDGKIYVSTRGKSFQLRPQKNDGTTKLETIGDYTGEGTRIEVYLNEEPDLTWAEQAIIMNSGDKYKGKTSAYWYSSESFFSLMQAAKNMYVRDIVAEFDGCSEPKAGRITKDFKNRLAPSLTNEETDLLLERMRNNSKPVNPDRLGFVGINEELPEFYANDSGTFLLESKKNNTLNAEIPFTIEVWAEQSKTKEFTFCTNKTPITGEVKTYYDGKEQSFYGNHFYYDCNVGDIPLEVWININTPYMPITSDGKEPDLNYFKDDIESILKKVINKVKRNITEDSETKKKQNKVILERLNEGIKKASGDGQYRFSLRQLFYTIRPYIIEECGRKRDPEYNYFSKIIAEYEVMHGNIPGMYRDSRGIIYHPHLSQTIPLGTLQVENYNRPKWTFNKVLYIEKEGFFETLISNKWPERNDCALLTSKGQATTAAKDLIDLLGDTEEELIFFCVHDADGAGTIIYQSLQKGTLSRPGRKVKVVNLGLEAEEGLKMDLPPEKVERKNKKRKIPVADYVNEYWKKWLQSYRIELNAMSTPQFLQWLDHKMEQYGNGKLIPPDQVMADKLKDSAISRIKEKVKEKILSEAGYEERVQKSIHHMTPVIEMVDNLRDIVKKSLQEVPENQWSKPVDQLAEEIVDQI